MLAMRKDSQSSLPKLTGLNEAELAKASVGHRHMTHAFADQMCEHIECYSSFAAVVAAVEIVFETLIYCVTL